VHVFYIKFLARCPNVSVFIEIPFEVPVDAGHQAIAPEVKLSAMYQQGIINIFLNNESLILGVPSRILIGPRPIHYYTFDFIEV